MWVAGFSWCISFKLMTFVTKDMSVSHLHTPLVAFCNLWRHILEHRNPSDGRRLWAGLRETTVCASWWMLSGMIWWTQDVKQKFPQRHCLAVSRNMQRECGSCSAEYEHLHLLTAIPASSFSEGKANLLTILQLFWSRNGFADTSIDSS